MKFSHLKYFFYFVNILFDKKEKSTALFLRFCLVPQEIWCLFLVLGVSDEGQSTKDVNCLSDIYSIFFLLNKQYYKFDADVVFNKMIMICLFTPFPDKSLSISIKLR